MYYLDLFLALHYGTQHFKDHCRIVYVMKNVCAVSVMKLADDSLLFFSDITQLLRKQMKDLMFTVFFSKLPFCYLLFLFYLSLSFPSCSDTGSHFWVLVFFFLVFYYHSKHYKFVCLLAEKMWPYLIPLSSQVISHNGWSQSECTHSL